MSYPTDRVILFDRDMNPLPELSANEVFSRIRSEEINGEHSLTIITTRRLEEGWRLLTVDGMGKWREWVVTEPDEEHASGKNALGTYHCVWSLQYDLTLSYAHTESEVGTGRSSTSIEAAETILDGVAGWNVGPCDGDDIAAGEGRVFIYESAWSKLSKIIEATTWEVDAQIEVSNVYGVVSRNMSLLAHVGSETATRRFDWNHDLTSIKRTPDPGPYYCRVVPLGKGETEYAEDDETTFEWPLDITEETGTEENPGPYWIQDDESAAVFRISDGNGGWIYPTKVVDYDEDDPELLLGAAMEDLHNHTRPNVTYEASVLQFEQAGMDVHGVALGDEVQCVDLGFNPDTPLRIQGRVTSIEVDELSPESTTQIVIGNLRDNMASRFNTMEQSLSALDANTSRVREQLAALATARYVKDLLTRINTEIAATGGYAYLTEGEGIVTYDVAVADPLVGSEATQVVQIKGGSIRIANSKNAGFAGIDDWDWKTVFTSGHVLAELVTAAAITSGYIGNATSSNYWNLDTGELVLRQVYKYRGNASIDTDILQTKHGHIVAGDYYYLFHGVPPVILESHSGCDVHGMTIDSYALISGSGLNEGDLGGRIAIVPNTGRYATGGSIMPNRNWSSIASLDDLRLISNYPSHLSNEELSMLCLHKKYASLCVFDAVSSAHTRTYSDGYGTSSLYVGLDKTLISSPSKIEIKSPDIDIEATTVDINGVEFGDDAIDVYTIDVMSLNTVGLESTGSIKSTKIIDINATTGINYIRPRLDIYGDFHVYDGTKSRVAQTENYDNRALYAYETPTPYFGDIGSGTTDSDGLAYISIDDIFSETARIDTAYQVFLQKCGQGDLWVKEKHATHFIVEGTPNLSFDWEVKARQAGFENIRLEDMDKVDMQDESHDERAEAEKAVVGSYDDDLGFIGNRQEELESLYDDYVSQMETIYEEELAA